MYDILLFDLDGTLTDSAKGIINSVSYALNKYGLELKDKSLLNQFIGPPLLSGFEKFCGITKEEAKKLVGLYREYYKEKGIFENEVYDGIPELLKALSKKKKRLIVATSKPEPFAVKILEHFGLAHYFEYIAGANFDETRTHKNEVIKYALESCGITDTSRTVMIGDREYDVLGAKEFNIDSIGVLYGYGSLEELTNAGANFIANTPADIFNIICK
ncbi:MAG: HAD family hydrolase [Clostridia bacterium]|nr:HAD family hydrolase [Clostridia bacterium]